LKKIACIPARYDSSRLKRKLLLDLGGKTVVEWVVESIISFGKFDEVFLLTDHPAIAKAVSGYDVKCLMTSAGCKSGTERIISALDELEGSIIINIQADEPFIDKEHLDAILQLMQNTDVKIGTLCHEFLDKDQIFNYNHVKVIFNKRKQALYFSRQAIPAVRDEKYIDWQAYYPYYKHVGIYGFKREALAEIALLSASDLENVEKLEQLRWLDHGMQIHVAVVKEPPITGIDTQEDYQKALDHLDNQKRDIKREG
jgi:3-deoxy-manno-octulosonate cytidylyltransferase (CMP-KDO synthetase)